MKEENKYIYNRISQIEIFYYNSDWKLLLFKIYLKNDYILYI
jgi:hypothetical protein